MLTEKRHEDILKLLQAQEVIQVAEVAQRFQVSMQTVRRDFKELEAQKLIRKVRGGAMLVYPRSQEPLYVNRAVSMLAEKKAIAAATATLISAGESLFIDLGTTTLEVAKQLGNLGLTVITNSLSIAQVLVESPNTKVHLAGGQLRAGEHSLSGTWTHQVLNQVYVDTAIVGAGGLTPEIGLTDFHLEEAAVRRLMIQQASRTLVVTDSSKLGITALVAVAPIQAIQTLITDSGADQKILKSLKLAGLEVIIAS